MFGLYPDDGTGIGSAGADPDNDGLTNAEEFARGSHPRGTAARYLAEGAAGTFFATRYAIANPHAVSGDDRVAPEPGRWRRGAADRVDRAGPRRHRRLPGA